MGMGEPFMNVDAVLEAARRLPDVGITHRRTTISTVGWVPGLAGSSRRSASRSGSRSRSTRPTPGCGSELMPVNDRYPLADVLALCRAHWERTKRRVFVEYVMLARRERLAGAGAAASRGSSAATAFKVNLIPYNPTGHVRRLVARGDRGVQGGARPGRRPATVRLTRGRDIAAACGQLSHPPRRERDASPPMR